MMTGQDLREFRLRTGLTQAEFGARLGVKRRTIYDWERRPIVPPMVALSVEALKALAA